MVSEPVPGAGQDGGPVPPGRPVTPDWMDDAEWELSGAARAAWDEDAPGEEWDSWADPEDGPPEWPEVPLAEITARAGLLARSTRR